MNKPLWEQIDLNHDYGTLKDDLYVAIWARPGTRNRSNPQVDYNYELIGAAQLPGGTHNYNTSFCHSKAVWESIRNNIRGVRSQQITKFYKVMRQGARVVLDIDGYTDVWLIDDDEVYQKIMWKVDDYVEHFEKQQDAHLWEPIVLPIYVEPMSKLDLQKDIAKSI